MAIATLVAITLALIARSLWIRRVTWRSRWEVAATLNIALQGAALLFTTSLASETVGQGLHALTGIWNLEDCIGHSCYIMAASSMACNAIGRLRKGHAMASSFAQRVQFPATLCIPLIIATFALGNGAKVYRPDFLTVPTDSWLIAYWLLLCGTLIYLLGYGSRALLVRSSPRFVDGLVC